MQGLFAYVRTCKTRFDTTKYISGRCNIAVQSCYFNHHSLTTCSIMHEHGCWFIMMVPTTLFKSVRSSSHEQSVPTCMNKPANNTVQAGQLNHVQACQQAKTSCAFLHVYLNDVSKNWVIIHTCFYYLFYTICFSFHRKYIKSLFWSALTLTTIGENESPETTLVRQFVWHFFFENIKDFFLRDFLRPFTFKVAPYCFSKSVHGYFVKEWN